MKRILLIVPKYSDELSNYTGILELPFIGKKAFMAPLHMATIAGLTPDEIEVDIWDEAVNGQISEETEFDKNYDLVGLTGYIADIPSAKAIAEIFRRRGIPVAIGGSGVSSAPEQCRDAFDILFIGEAELTWPQFIADWRNGSYRHEYRQVTPPDMTISPLPRWDILAEDMKSYLMGAVQTTRGCPFDCDFCDVIYLFGRRLRQKPIDSVLEEIRLQERLGMERILICDDNFTGNHQYSKDLLRELIPINNSFEKPLQFATQLSIDVAKDEELLELMADANFNPLFIGIESVNKESLKEANKFQNYRTNLIEDCKKVQSYGIAIKGAMIVGFDHDDTTVFDQQFEFLQEVCIPLPIINLLKAPLGTKLWARLLKEGRILKPDSEAQYAMNPRAATNIIPKRMTRAELLANYGNLVERIHDWGNFAARIKGFVSGIQRRPNVPLKAPAGERSSELREFFFSMDESTRAIVLDIIQYTREHAPFMLGKIIGLILQQYSEAAIMVPALREAIDRQIELEAKVDIAPFIDRRKLLIPEPFREAYKEVFPSIHQRIYSGLENKTRTPEALIEVFTDFLTRWGETFEKWEDHYRVFLFELADRAVAKENDSPRGSYEAAAEALASDTRRLADWVLRAVEQRLRSDSR